MGFSVKYLLHFSIRTFITWYKQNNGQVINKVFTVSELVILKGHVALDWAIWATALETHSRKCDLLKSLREPSRALGFS